MFMFFAFDLESDDDITEKISSTEHIQRSKTHFLKDPSSAITFYEEDDEEFFSVNCPYCNANIMVSSFEHDSEIECPECKNMIELDWEFDEDDELDNEDDDDSDDMM